MLGEGRLPRRRRRLEGLERRLPLRGREESDAFLVRRLRLFPELRACVGIGRTRKTRTIEADRRFGVRVVAHVFQGTSAPGAPAR